MLLKLNKRWQEYEKYQLYVAHAMRCSFKVMEAYFGRNTSSLNKYLNRSGIRQALKDHQPLQKLKSVDQLSAVIIEYGLDKETVGLERQKTRNWAPSDLSMEKMHALGLRFPVPWIPKTQSKLLPVNSGIGRQKTSKCETYVSMDVISHYLIRHGHAVKRFKARNPHNWTFIINNKPATDAQLLIQGNIQRHRNREPLFLVEGITCE